MYDIRKPAGNKQSKTYSFAHRDRARSVPLWVWMPGAFVISTSVLYLGSHAIMALGLAHSFLELMDPLTPSVQGNPHIEAFATQARIMLGLFVPLLPGLVIVHVLVNARTPIRRDVHPFFVITPMGVVVTLFVWSVGSAPIDDPMAPGRGESAWGALMTGSAFGLAAGAAMKAVLCTLCAGGLVAMLCNYRTLVGRYKERLAIREARSTVSDR